MKTNFKRKHQTISKINKTPQLLIHNFDCVLKCAKQHHDLCNSWVNF